MPASLFTEMERTNRTLEEQRAIELALELMGLNNENDNIGCTYDGEPRSKKSQNTTECVPVPSSEHVAEIVGRQGCKIKALRAKTNTYIKTPVRGEEPVFVVTGRKEDVSAAKREILSAAEHFSQIRAQRKSSLSGSLIPGPNSNIPGQTTIQVRVPYRVVGLVVGPKGATIKRIQQQTNTYIVTPSRDKDPVFEVTGMPDNVENARKEIEGHIAQRTGTLYDPLEDGSEFLDQSFTNNLNIVNSSLFKTDLNSGFMHPFSQDSNNILDLHDDSIFNFAVSATNGSAKLSDPYTSVFTSFGKAVGLYDNDEGLGDSPTFDMPGPPLITSSWPDFTSASLTDSLFSSTSVSGMSDLTQRSNSISGALAELVIGEHQPARRIRSDPEVNSGDGGITTSIGTLTSFSPLIKTTPGVLINSFPPTSSNSASGSMASSPTESVSTGPKVKRDCIVCFESAVVAALVPCGHNLFCLECASRICQKKESECPICRQPASQAIRIYS